VSSSAWLGLSCRQRGGVVAVPGGTEVPEGFVDVLSPFGKHACWSSALCLHGDGGEGLASAGGGVGPLSALVPSC
jgi:hypothetical protein